MSRMLSSSSGERRNHLHGLWCCQIRATSALTSDSPEQYQVQETTSTVRKPSAEDGHSSTHDSSITAAEIEELKSGIEDVALRMFLYSSGKSRFNFLRKSRWRMPSGITKRMRSMSSGKRGIRHCGEADCTKAKEDHRGSFTSDRELVMKMLKRENDLRFSRETQSLYDETSRSLGQASVPPSTIEDKIQMQVLQEHNIEPTHRNIHKYRCLNYLYRDDKEVRELVVYMSKDRSREGDLRVGDLCPDVPLLSTDLVKLKLTDLLPDDGTPLLLFAASRS